MINVIPGDEDSGKNLIEVKEDGLLKMIATLIVQYVVKEYEAKEELRLKE